MYLEQLVCGQRYIPKSKQHKKNTIQEAIEITSILYKYIWREHKILETNFKRKRLLNRGKETDKSSSHREDVVLEILKKAAMCTGKTKVIKKKMHKIPEAYGNRQRLGKLRKDKDLLRHATTTFVNVVLELTDDDDEENVWVICESHYLAKMGQILTE